MITKQTKIPAVYIVILLTLCFLGIARATLTVSPSKLGNVFYTTETVSIPVTASVGTSVSWTVTDYFGFQVGSGTSTVSSQTATITPTTSGKIGYFYVALSEKTGATVNSTNSTQFTIITTPPTQTNSPYGVQTHFAADYPTPTPLAIAPLLVRAGILNIRDEQYWDYVEATKGTYTWSTTYSNYMSTAATNGLNPLIALEWSNKFYDYTGGVTTGPTTTAGLAGFGSYAYQVVNRWNAQVSAVEVWNEYNGSFLAGPATADRPLYYYQLLQSVWNAVKPTYPNVNIVGMSTYPIAHGFIKGVLDKGGNAYFNTISVHPYRAVPEGVDVELTDLINLAKGYNGGVAKPIWATEFSLGGTSAAEYFQEPSYLVRMVAQMQTVGVAKMSYYTVQDNQSTPYRGLVGKADASRGNYLANPVYAAYATAIRQLYGWTANGRITSGMATTTFIYRFNKSGDNKYICWGGAGFNPAPTTLQFSIPVATATMTDLMGNVTTLTASGGKITVPIDGVEPVYITIPGAAASAIVEASNPVVADSVAGYSKTQGGNGWSYGSITGAYSFTGFTPLPWAIWSYDNYRWTASSGYPFITMGQFHPGTGKCTILRWTSTTSGNVVIAGTITAPTSTSNSGVFCSIYRNGTPLYAPAMITPGQVINYSIPNVTLANGDIIDFVETPNGSQNFGATGWTARITKVNMPTNVIATPANTMAMLTWPPVASAVQYSIKRSTTSGGPYTTVTSTAVDPCFANTGLTNGTTYYYVVSATDAGGVESPNSAQVSVIPASTPPASPWVSQDIGTVGTPGIDNLSGNIFIVGGAGAGYGGTADAFHFLSQPVTGNCTITAKVLGQYTSTNAWAGAGVMLRETSATGSRFAVCEMTLDHGASFEYRNTTGGSMSGRTLVTAYSPYWIRMVRNGNVFTGYTSPDGVAWTQLGTPQTITMSSTLLVGLTSTSWKTSLIYNAFTNVSITTP